MRFGMMLAFALLLAGPALGQNPVQWSGDARGSVRLAREQSLPLLFWVSGGGDADDDDLEDAQEESFRDPDIVDFIHRRFVPVRVSRNSDVIDATNALGLPTGHGLYCAVLTPDGRLLDSMGPGEVADPPAFFAHLRSAFDAYCNDLFESELRPLLENHESPKSKARLAAQTVYRLGIRQADTAMIGLLDRPDLTPAETSRLYAALAALGTEACISTLLDDAENQAAAGALMKAPPEALEWLLPELPGAEGEPAPRQLVSYRSVAKICRRSPRPDSWWASATAEAREKEVASLTERALAVQDYAKSL